MSFSRKIFTEFASVGPVYFILLLFGVRLIYLLLDRFVKNESAKLVVVIAISLFGVKIGEAGLWLPWSADVACYALIFYQLGIYFRRYDLLNWITKHQISYFPLACIWAYMIYAGSMEIAIRNYGQYGLTIIGATAGILLVYKMAKYLENTLPVIARGLGYLGKHSLYIIIIHTLCGGMVNQFVVQRFDKNYMYYMVSSILLQVALALIVQLLISSVKKWCTKKWGTEK